MKALVFTYTSLYRFSTFEISNGWFDKYEIPASETILKRVDVDSFIYIIEKDLEGDELPIVVINIDEENPVFYSLNAYNSSILERIITVARSVESTDVKIPYSWSVYHHNNCLSVNAISQQKEVNKRIYFEKHPNKTRDLFVYAFTERPIRFGEISIQSLFHSEARRLFQDAILSPGLTFNNSNSGIVLTKRLPQGFIPDASLDEWIKSKLTLDQLNFVQKPHNGPVRLRGAAGTGKTLALIIKFINDARLSPHRIKYCFITNSTATVDLVMAIIDSLDVGAIRSKHTLEVRTLYDIATSILRIDLDGLYPLSLDGREGRNIQFELIGIVLNEMSNQHVIKVQFENISDHIRDGWNGIGEEKNIFIKNLMNEFASVVDAEGIKPGSEKYDKYVCNSVRRAAWLMKLPEEDDRRFVLEVHSRYKVHLRKMNTLSVDQMVADFNDLLDSNRWDNIREREGYDAIFVDEFHLFTAMERQMLHKLVKQKFDENGILCRPPIFMAYDLKQSPRDTFTQMGEVSNNLFNINSGLQKSELVRLNKIFRYTPEIADLLADIDASYPAINVGDDWDEFSVNTDLENGRKPELVVFKNNDSLLSYVQETAQLCARKNGGGGRRVAVLCLSESLFDSYINNNSFQDRCVKIVNREPTSELRHAGKRFVFSMPEYVAGLQFDTVFLIHVDQKESYSDLMIGDRRRFISNVYLGASRAEKTLYICSSQARGGKSEILNLAIERGSLIEKSISR